MIDLQLSPGIDQDIFQVISQWRILDLKTLHKKLPMGTGYNFITKRVAKLEKQGLLKSYYYFFKNRKYIYASKKLLQEIIKDGSTEIIKAHLHHDLILVKRIR